MKRTMSNKEYNEYIEEITPSYNILKNCFHAFGIGGTICLIGECFFHLYHNIFHFNELDSASMESVTLIFLSVVLTGLNLYNRIARRGGAGALVPITGFANSVASPAIEYQKEGQIFGIGVKIFTISGPVILYGIFVSWLLGLIYYLGISFHIW